MKRIKALVLLSGGLDSILAVKILQKQEIRIVGLTFRSYFFGASQAEKTAKLLKIPLEVIDFSQEHLEMVKKPKYGYGKGMNPCIDCHALMLKQAKKIMKRDGFDFVATGEVLGERPMSQNKQALKLVEKQSGLQGYLLRPLSAKLLEETIPEKKEMINRQKLFAISGRSRKKQIELAKKWKVKEYPSPAGGCILTDLEFSKKLKELFKKYPEACGNDIELLKAGRHFWFDNVKVVVGRNQEENLRLRELVQGQDVLIELKNVVGPTTLVRKYGGKKIQGLALKKAQELTKYYSTKARQEKEIKFLIEKIAPKQIPIF